MGGFTEAETRALMAQHTEEAGQRFSSAAQEAVWTQTRGQPWLVNALCAGACFDNKAGRDCSRVKQTLGYMKKCGAEKVHLVVIDRRPGAEECRDGEGGADGSGRRLGGRGVVVWTL